MRIAHFIAYRAVLLSLTLGYVVAVPCFAHDEKAEGEKDIKAVLAKLNQADRSLAEAQRWCAVNKDDRLGSMGAPVKIILEGKPVFLCCPDCEKEAKADAKVTLKTVDKLKKINSAMAKLPAADRHLAEEQRFCAVLEKNELGSMGTPVKVMLEGHPVFLCCAGCKSKAQADPKAALAKATKAKNGKGGHGPKQ